MASTSPVALSVVVPVRDAAATLGTCLDALAAQRGAPGFEVIVVDNASRDAGAALARSHPVVTSVISETRPGSYAARNAGIGAARGGVLAFTDADCVPDPDWLAEGAGALGAGADMVGGAVVPLRSARQSIWERYDRAVYLDQRHHVEAGGFAATANLFVRREVFDAVGAFDGALISSGDLEFGRRATAAGFDLRFADRARVGHHPRRTLAATWRLHRRLGAGWAQLSRRGAGLGWRHEPALRVGLGSVAAAVAADGRRLPRPALAPVHAVAMSARWVGWLTGR
ncbi:MAG: glycosyltransferase family 2 protein [Acidimicrobiales bacterium]